MSGKRTLWLAAAGGDPIEIGRHYVTIEVIGTGLARRWFGTSRWRPIIMAEFAAGSEMRTQVHQSALIDPRQLSADMAAAGSAVSNSAVRTLVNYAPWTGAVSGEVRLLSLRSEKLLKQIMGLADTIHGKLDEVSKAGAPKDNGVVPGGAPLDASDEGHESLLLAPVIDAAFDVVKKAGGAVIGEVAKMIVAEDGSYTSKLEGPFAAFPARTGYHVLLSEKGAAPTAVEVKFAGAGETAPEVLVDGKRPSGRDFMVLRVRVDTKHNDIESIPGVAETWKTLRSIAASGGDTAAAYKAFRAAVTFAPELLAHDKEALIKMVDDLVGKLPGVGQESALGDSIVQFFSVALNAVWKAGSFERAAPASARQPPPKSTTARPTGAKAAPAEASTPTTPPAPPPVMSPAGSPRAEPSLARFDHALEQCLKWEGGYSDNPADRGGKTNFGITNDVYCGWVEARGDVPGQDGVPTIEHITRDTAKTIYWSNFWRAARCDELESPLEVLMFDAAVNHGPAGAAKLLQRALNALATVAGGEQLKVDGGIGPKTFAAVKAHKTPEVGHAYMEERRALYRRIVEKDPTQKVFLNGWMNRVRDVEKMAGLDQAGLESAEITPENTPFAGYVD